MFKRFKIVLLTSVLTSASFAAENVDLEMMTKIRYEGFTNSKVMELTSYLTDDIGQRLAGSPSATEANQWAMQTFKKWGLSNTHLEGFEFGRGWSFEHVSVDMIEPRIASLQAAPVSWFPGTDGDVEGEVFSAVIKTEKDFEKYKGKLKGKIVALTPKAKFSEFKGSIYRRQDEESIAKAMKFKIPSKNKTKSSKENLEKKYLKRQKTRDFNNKVWQFYKDEGVVATIKSSRSLTGGIIGASGYYYKIGFTPVVPQLVIGAEGYNRILRLMKKGKPVKLRINVKAKFYDDDINQYNVLTEIAGKGRNPQVVMAGAHIDSWHLGDGAADNAAGVAVVMEAIRILKTLGIKPKRTIRVALWGAEEQGMFGSRSYIKKHFADYPKLKMEGITGEPAYGLRDSSQPLTMKPEYNKLSLYLNFDNGSGKIRGIHTHGNLETVAIFEEWFKPFHDLGADTVSTRSSGSTDHAAFQNAGLPGYQFIQDPLDYFTRLHHTQLDVLDYVSEQDLKQASVIMAAFLYNASMRKDRMPRNPVSKDFIK